MNLHIKYQTLLQQYQVVGVLRLSHFFGQIHHESNLKPVSENLNYSESGLLTIFPKYFTKETAKLYARKPQQIANIVYANRMGNTGSNDGWNYRGRGFIQITGKTNYTKLSSDTGIDYISNPDLLLQESDAMLSALWFWKSINGNKWADKDDVKTITKLINGGFNGLSDRQAKVKYYQGIWKSL
jgi:putative chitinase